MFFDDIQRFQNMVYQQRFDEAEKAKKAYGEQKKQNASADLCKKCGACEKVCPQGLSIRADLEKVAKELNTEEV